MADTGQDTDRVQFELVSPTRLVLSEAVDMVVVPGAEGDFGVLPGHTPLIATVRPGVIDIHQDGEITKRLFVEGGFAEAAPERCTVLTKSAQPVEEMDSQAASQRMEVATKALEDLTGDEGRESAEAELIAAQAMADAAG